MTAIELYKYIQENNIEWHYRDNDGNEDVIIFSYTFQLEDFIKLLSGNCFDDGGIEISLMNGYVAIWMQDICEYYGIELKEVFDKEKEP